MQTIKIASAGRAGGTARKITPHHFVAALLIPLLHVAGLAVWLLAPAARFDAALAFNPILFSLVTLAVCSAGMLLAAGVLVLRPARGSKRRSGRQR